MDLIGMHFSFGFFLGSPVGVIPGTPQRMAPLEILLGGFLLWIFLLKISMIPFVDFLIFIMGLLGLDYILHKWNHVCRELLHLWRAFLACWIVAGTILLCLMFISLFFFRCTPYGICSVPFMVLCTSRLLNVVPMMIYRLDNCVLLSLLLVRWRVCDYNRILQKYGCRLIGGEEFLVVLERFDWLLLAVVICITIEDRSIYLRCIVPLWSDFWRSVFISLHCFPCDYLRGIIDTWCSLL